MAQPSSPEEPAAPDGVAHSGSDRPARPDLGPYRRPINKYGGRFFSGAFFFFHSRGDNHERSRHWRSLITYTVIYVLMLVVLFIIGRVVNLICPNSGLAHYTHSAIYAVLFKPLSFYARVFTCMVLFSMVIAGFAGAYLWHQLRNKWPDRLSPPARVARSCRRVGRRCVGYLHILRDHTYQTLLVTFAYFYAASFCAVILIFVFGNASAQRHGHYLFLLYLCLVWMSFLAVLGVFHELLWPSSENS